MVLTISSPIISLLFTFIGIYIMFHITNEYGYSE